MNARYVRKALHDLRLGDELDMGTFASLHARDERTMLVVFTNGLTYVESINARVRVWA